MIVEKRLGLQHVFDPLLIRISDTAGFVVFSEPKKQIQVNRIRGPCQKVIWQNHTILWIRLFIIFIKKSHHLITLHFNSKERLYWLVGHL